MRRVAVLLSMLLAVLAYSHWAGPNLDVPITRLIGNLEGQLKKKPKDAMLNYEIGRLHSMAFAEGEVNGRFYGTISKPVWPPMSSVKVTRSNPRLRLTDLKHLRESLIYYHTATTLEPKSGLYRLGLGWMYEEAAPYAPQLGSLPWFKAATADELRAKALKTYRSIYVDYVQQDLKAPGHLAFVEDVYVSEDAGEGILRLSPNLSETEKRAIRANVEKLKKNVTGITPIVFPLYGDSTLESICAPKARVPFDMLGGGPKQNWSWVTDRAGILVWDPRHTGKIDSGRQLFGSTTFFVFFSDGYAALASLDDNRDGWLTGRELAGIAVWRDVNVNGISEPGEVVPVARLGVTAIRTSGVWNRGVLTASDGIRFADGRVAPTFDWIAQPRRRQ